MAKELISRLINQVAWRLPLKVFFFGLFLFTVLRSDFSFFSVLVFFLVLSAIYFSEMPERHFVRVSFWIFPVLILFVLNALKNSFWFFPMVFLSLAVFFLILALCRLFFKNRFVFYEILNSIILFGISAFYFSLPEKIIIGKVIFFLVLIFVFREALVFFGFNGRKRGFLIASVMSFIALQIAWLLDFLPFGFLNSAVFVTLFSVLARDSFLVYRSGLLTYRFFLKEALFFVVLIFLIFVFSPWRI